MKYLFSYRSKCRRDHNDVVNFATVVSSSGGLVEVGGNVEVIMLES